MRKDLSYRGYTIFRDGTMFVAEPENREDFIFEIAARTIKRLVEAIDELWCYLDRARGIGETQVPAWYMRWMSAGGDGRVFLDGFSRICGHRRNLRFYPTAIAASIFAALVVLSSYMLDVNHDGVLNALDFTLALDRAALAHPPDEITRRIRFDDKVYWVTMKPDPADDADFRADKVLLNGVKVEDANCR